MEMERINDDTFLLRIENQDLIDRGSRYATRMYRR